MDPGTAGTAAAHLLTAAAAAPHHDIGPAIRDWTIAVAAVIAAIGAASAAITAAHAYRRQIDDAHRAQASRVAAWVEGEWKPVHMQPRGVLIGEFVRLRNASRQPIFNVVILVRDSETRRGLTTLQHGTIPPEHDETADVTQRVNTRTRQTSLFLTMSFVDSAGTRWRRDTDTGQLTEEH